MSTILGLSGGFDPVHTNEFQFPHSFAHDSAAVLLQNGRVVSAIEEERLNRIKHTNKLWTRAASRSRLIRPIPPAGGGEP